MLMNGFDRLLWLREVHRAFCRRGMVFVRRSLSFHAIHAQQKTDRDVSRLAFSLWKKMTAPNSREYKKHGEGISPMITAMDRRDESHGIHSNAFPGSPSLIHCWEITAMLPF